MADGFWDRVTGERVAGLPACPLLNRYQLAAAGVVNGRDAPAYSPVLPAASGRWSASALPEQALALRVTAIAAALAEAAVSADTAYDRWAAVPPVATGKSRRSCCDRPRPTDASRQRSSTSRAARRS